MPLTNHVEQKVVHGRHDLAAHETSTGVELTTCAFVPYTDEKFPLTTPVLFGLKATRGSLTRFNLSLPRFDVDMEIPVQFYFDTPTSEHIDDSLSPLPHGIQTVPRLFVHPHWMTLAQLSVIQCHPELEHAMRTLFEDQGTHVVRRLQNLYTLVRNHPASRTLFPNDPRWCPPLNHNHYY